jgi:hypothetical protein
MEIIRYVYIISVYHMILHYLSLLPDTMEKADILGMKHYSGPIKAVTKWETGVEIDLQSALTSQRSKPSAASVISKPDFGSGEARQMAGKDDSTGGTMPVFTESAAASSGTGSEWTDGTDTSGTGGTGSTVTRETVSRIRDRHGGSSEGR